MQEYYKREQSIPEKSELDKDSELIKDIIKTNILK